jgi:type IV pilus assembly protein PilX
VTIPFCRFPRQHGAALFVALVFLILIALIAITASGTAVLEQRMIGGTRNTQLAQLGSESALRGAEVELWTAARRSVFSAGGLVMPPCATTGAQPCVYQRKNGVPDARVTQFRTASQWLNADSDGANAYGQTVTGLTGSDTSASLATLPRYLIEDLGLDIDATSTGRMGGKNLSAQGATDGTPKIHLYRITARAQGSSATSWRVTESVFSAYPNNAFNVGN